MRDNSRKNLRQKSRPAPAFNLERLEPRTLLSVTFGDPTTYAGITEPGGIVAADFNGDGRPDVAVSGGAYLYSGHNGQVAVYMNTGKGKFGAPTYLAIGDQAHPGAQMLAEDFNNDGKMDLAVLNRANLSLEVFLGNGDGTFKAPQITANSGGIAVDILGTQGTMASADFNHDGIADLVLPAAGGETRVLLGNGDGTFHPGQLVLAPPAVNPQVMFIPIQAADFNGDGNSDVAYAVADGSNVVYVADGDGAGGFSGVTSYTFPGEIGQILVADVNGDHKPDLVVSNFDDTDPAHRKPQVDVLLNNGHGFDAGPVLSSPAVYPGLVAADFNRDGKIDLLGGSGDGSVIFYAGHGDGTFADPMVTQVAPSVDVHWSYVAADFNGDGRLDLADATSIGSTNIGGFEVLLGGKAGTGNFRFGTQVSTSVNTKLPKTIAAGNSTSIHPSLTLTDSAAKTFSGNSTVELFLTNGTAMTALSAPATQSLHIKAHKHHKIRLSAVALPLSLSAGTYRLVAKVTDATGGVSYGYSTRGIIVT